MAKNLVEFELVGARNFEALLDRASLEVHRQVERVCQETAFRIVQRAKSLAPRDQGHLQSVIAAKGKGTSWRVGLLDTRFPSRGGSSSHQHPWVYGVWYEYGFVTRNIPRRPFIRPAAESEEARHEAALAEALNAGLQVAA